MATATPALSGTPECVWDAGAELGEGALWSPRTQSLWWVDILGRRLHRLRAADRARRTWAFDEEISAVAERADGHGLVVTLRHSFADFDPETPGARPVPRQRPPEEPPGNRFNDGKCDARGRFWGGSMDFACAAPTGALYRFDPDGRCTRHVDGYAVTNGPTWSADGRTLYVNDTVRGEVHAYDFDMAEGRLSNRRVWLKLPPGDGVPDGMITDADGNLWIAHWGGACVSCHDPVTARELRRIALPTRNITSCAFGGPDLRTLFITSASSGLSAAERAAEPLAGALFAVDMDVAGVPAALFGQKEMP